MRTDDSWLWWRRSRGAHMAVNIRDVYDISLVHLSEFAEVEHYRNFSLKFYQGTCEILTSDMVGGLAIIYTNLQYKSNTGVIHGVSQWWFTRTEYFHVFNVICSFV